MHIAAQAIGNRHGVVYGTGSQPTRPVRAEGDQGLPRPINQKKQRLPAIMAKEPLPPRTVVQCVVASTPGTTGSGLARWLVLVAPAGACCFQLDELRAMLLQFRECVKHYMTLLAIVLRHVAAAI